MKWIKRSSEQLNITGGGLVAMACLLAGLSLQTFCQPSDGAWILVYILKPVPYFIFVGITLALGLFLMILNSDKEES